MTVTARQRARPALADPGDIENADQLILIVHPEGEQPVTLAEGDLPVRRIAAASHHDRVPRLIHQIHHALDEGIKGR